MDGTDNIGAHVADTPTDIVTTRVGSITGTTGDQWPHLVDATGAPLLQDTGVWGVAGVDLGATCQHQGKTFIFFGDVVAKGPEAFPGSDLVAWSDDAFVSRHGGHQFMGLRFILPIEPFASEGEPGWMFCTSCHSLVSTGAPARVCAGTFGGDHTPLGLPFRLPFSPTGIRGQDLWRRCSRCAAAFYSGYGAATPNGCPAGGPHVAANDKQYVLPTIGEGESVSAEAGQPDWRYCVRCAGLFWNGYAQKGICAGSPGGGIRLRAVLDSEGRYSPFRSTDPVGELQLNETPNAAFSFEGRAYVFAGTGFRPRAGDPAAGQYVCSKVDPSVEGDFETEFLFSPRIGCCAVDMPPGERSPSLLSHVPLGFKFILPRAAPNTPPGERGWHICIKCESLFHSEFASSGGACQSGGAHVPRVGYEFALRLNVAEDHEYQSEWRQCTKCAALFWIDVHGDAADTGRCPGGGRHVPHDARFAARHSWRQEDAHNQPGWRFCTKCHGLYFYAYVGRSQGVCPRDGNEHLAQGLEFVLPHDVGESPTQQENWRFCDDCFGLFYDGYANKGFCPHPKNGVRGHRAAGFVFALPHDLPASPERQSDWRYCFDCHGLFFAAYGTGCCPATRAPHRPIGWNFQLPAQAGVGPDDRPFRYCVRCRCMVRFEHPIDTIKGHALDAEQANWAPWLAACVVDNRRHARDLASVLDGSPRQGLVMLGYDGFTFRLAWMPLWPGAKPRFDTIRYYHRGKDRWSEKPDLSAGSHLFANERIGGWRWTHVSAQWIDQAQCWIVIYQKANGEDFAQPVVARIGRGLFDWSEEFVLFEKQSGPGVYMHHDGVPDDFYPRLPPVLPNDGGNAFAYGAFILDRYTQWDPASRTLDLHYLLSTWIPYQVHVMHSQIRIPPASLLDVVFQIVARSPAGLRAFVRLLGG